MKNTYTHVHICLYQRALVFAVTLAFANKCKYVTHPQWFTWSAAAALFAFAYDVIAKSKKIIYKPNTNCVIQFNV